MPCSGLHRGPRQSRGCGSDPMALYEALEPVPQALVTRGLRLKPKGCLEG